MLLIFANMYYPAARTTLIAAVALASAIFVIQVGISGVLFMIKLGKKNLSTMLVQLPLTLTNVIFCTVILIKYMTADATIPIEVHGYNNVHTMFVVACVMSMFQFYLALAGMAHFAYNTFYNRMHWDTNPYRYRFERDSYGRSMLYPRGRW